MAETTKLLRIAEAARRLGVHQQTLRRWSDLGLVQHSRTPSGERRYDPADLDSVMTEIKADDAPEARSA
jgi:DNA-binding transcriptional MerR regulator